MRAQTLATIALTIVVLGLAVISITRPVPTTTQTVPVYRSHDNAGTYGGSAYGGRSQASTKYAGCSFDGNPSNDKPGACPPYPGSK